MAELFTCLLSERMESRGGQDGENAARALVYDVRSTDDDIAVRAYVWANTPAMYDGLCKQSINLDPLLVDENSALGIYVATVHYGMRPPPKEAGEASFSFDTGGGTQHITQAKATIASYGTSPPSFGGAIGVSHDAVEGVDVVVPQFAFTVTRYVAASSVDGTYVTGLYGLTGKVNNAAWTITVDGVTITFAEGEVRFDGAAGTKRASDDWELTLKFSASKNVTGLTVGSITGIAKKGWEYMWVRYDDSVDANVLVKKPVAVYVEKVYDTGDFAALGI